jgi:lipopolysaccharide biosynthesis glycosyltransferase
MKSDCAVCYVTDRGFLFPTVVSCLSLREFWKPDQGDIFVFLVDSDHSYTEFLTEQFLDYGIQFRSINSKLYDRFDERNWNKTHVPKSALGRFLIGNLIPDRYRRLLYLDGDTIVAKDPSTLLAYDPEPNYVAAAEDISYFSRRDLTAYGRFVRGYFRGIGVDGTHGYFNSGVFIAQRATWCKIAEEALEFFVQNVEACKFHDQSAMNAVLGPRRKRLSLAWNFQTPFRYLEVERDIQPAIYHFTQSAKPWMGKVDPWTDFHDRYADFHTRLVDLNLEQKTFSASEIDAINYTSSLQRKRMNTIFLLRLIFRRIAIRRLEKRSV